jgi:hypothetical protein
MRSTHRENRCSLVIVTSGLARSQKMQTCWGMIRKLAPARDALRQVTGLYAISLRDSHDFGLKPSAARTTPGC